MPMPIDSLSKSDYDILAYINQYDHVSKEQIIGHFNGKIDALEYRLEYLSKPEHSAKLKCILADSNYIEEEFDHITDSHTHITTLKSKHSFHITPLGLKALQDYNIKKKLEHKNLWLKNAWIPIIVAFVTTVLTNYILPMLPKILQWLSNFLLKNFS